MGYYTDFTIEWNCDNNAISERFEKIFKDWGMESGDYYITENYLSINAKWYDMEADLCAISKEFPDVMFIICGNGEGFDDLWREWWQNGKWEYHKAEIAPFNPNEMEEYKPPKAPYDVNAIGESYEQLMGSEEEVQNNV